MHTSPILIAIDAGGTAVKVVAFDLEGAEIAHATADVHTDHHPDGRVERDPDAFWQGTLDATRQVTRLCRGRRILGVGCTGFGNGVFLVDEQGAATRPGIVSVDHRAEPVVETLRATGEAGRIEGIIGCKIWGGQTLMQLAHLSRHEPEVMARTRWALSCKDFIRFRLTGSAFTDPTDASGGGLLDLANGTYATEVFDLLDIPGIPDRLPEMMPSDAVAGRLSAQAAEQTGIPEGTPVAGSMMDVAACTLGAGATGESLLTMIAGTWSINCLEASGPPVGQTPLLNMLYRRGGARLVAEGSPSSAANLGWYLRAMGGRLDLDEASDLVAQAPVQVRRGQFLPFIFGPEPRRGGFVDLGPADDLGTMVRAIFEGVVFQHLSHARDAATQAGRDMPGIIRLAGGAAKSEVWSQIFADICQRPVEAVHAAEVGALGAAICAAVAGGAFGTLDQALSAMTRVTRTFDPDPGPGTFYAARFADFQRLDQGMARLLAPHDSGP